jgi:hypothetical protein
MFCRKRTFLRRRAGADIEGEPFAQESEVNAFLLQSSTLGILQAPRFEPGHVACANLFFERGIKALRRRVESVNKANPVAQYLSLFWKKPIAFLILLKQTRD